MRCTSSITSSSSYLTDMRAHGITTSLAPPLVHPNWGSRMLYHRSGTLNGTSVKPWDDRLHLAQRLSRRSSISPGIAPATAKSTCHVLTGKQQCHDRQRCHDLSSRSPQPPVVRRPLTPVMLDCADGTIKRREGAHRVAGGARRKEGCAILGCGYVRKGAAGCACI